MKLSTIIRAIAQGIVPVRQDSHHLMITSSSNLGPGIRIRVTGFFAPPVPTRARLTSIGNLEIAWWGRDTLVHPTEAS